MTTPTASRWPGAANPTADPNPLAAHYRRFRVTERILLTGHSHQAWPDVAAEGHARAWEDAARLVDEKWERAFAQAERVSRGYATLLGDADDWPSVALAPSTHDLLVKLLSALPLQARPRLVTTDGEFHAIRRQLARLAEEGVEVVLVPSDPADAVADRLASAVNGRTAAVLVSSVLYQSARIVPDLGRTMEACARAGVPLVVDMYHALNVVPVSLEREGLAGAYVVGGGYKYCQLGEGNGFLRIPPDCDLRPVMTGWFSEFAELTAEQRPGQVAYGAGAARFAGATYDPTSQYRGAAVFDFFAREGLAPTALRRISQHQMGILARGFDALDLDPRRITRDRSVPLEGLGGFLALESPHAGELRRRLLAAGVYTDHRDRILRLGPAPYLSDRQLEAGLAALAEAVRGLDVSKEGG